MFLCLSNRVWGHYTQAATLQPQNKDWDEDLKARCGEASQPAEEHPQLVEAGPVCQRIGARCAVAQPERVAQQLPALLQQYRNNLRWGRFEQAMECMENMAALALSAALREYRQMGKGLTPEQGAEILQSYMQPHQNRSSLKNRADEIAVEIQSVLTKNSAQGIRTEAEKKGIANAWLNLAVSCAKVPVKYAADEWKRQQKELQNRSEQILSLAEGQ